MGRELSDNNQTSWWACFLGLFSQLWDKFTSTASDLYRYLQLRHQITKNTDWENIRRDPSNLGTHFEHPVSKRQTKNISVQKNIFDMWNNKLHINQQWKLELNVVLDDDCWENECCGCHNGLQASFGKIEWKIETKFFRTISKTFVSKNNPNNKY